MLSALKPLLAIFSNMSESGMQVLYPLSPADVSGPNAVPARRLQTTLADVRATLTAGGLVESLLDSTWSYPVAGTMNQGPEAVATNTNQVFSVIQPLIELLSVSGILSVPAPGP